MNDPSPVSPAPSPSRSWRRLFLRLFLWLVVFGSGVVVGGGGSLLTIRQGLLERIHHPEAAPARLAANLQRFLDLDDAQTEQVERIFHRRQLALQDIRRRVQPEVEEQLDAVEREVSAQLNDQQRQKWETRFRQLRKTWFPAPPPPPVNSPQ